LRLVNHLKAENHFAGGIDNSTGDFSYVVFTDPQFGLMNMLHEGGEGIDWSKDIDHMEILAAKVNALKPKPSFIFCTGDLANAYPTNLLIEANDPDWKRALGFKAPYRTPQTVDLITSLNRFDSSIPVLFNAGNHDLSEDPERYQLDAFQRVWGDTYFHFWAHGRLFIALETQFFRSSQPETIDLMLEEIHWLEELFNTMPKDIPKTVMMHAPLFIDNVLETDSDEAKAIPSHNRHLILNLFCQNNVDLIYSGHTHNTHFPPLHDCGSHKLKQIILTSINAQLDWQSDTKYYPIGKPQFIHTVIQQNQRNINLIDL